MKNFIDINSNTILAQAEIPENFILGGQLDNRWQHNYVPFVFSVHALNPEKKISIFALSEELYTHINNKMIYMGVNNDPTYIKEGVRQFVDPDNYIAQIATSIFGSSLKATAKATLPSLNNKNKQQKYAEMMNFYNMLFQTDARFGVATQANNTIYDNILIRFEGIKNNEECVILAGADYKGVEYYAPQSSMGGFGLFGGLFNSQPINNRNSKFGYGKPCDALEWGSDARYIMVCPKELEREASEIFINFLNSYQINPNLINQAKQLVLQRCQQREQITAQFQGIAQQNQMRNIQLQRQTSQMISQNSRDISAGIMDSWNKKMESQDRISSGFSQAIRGVDTYQTMRGQTIEASVSADHVYENKYGDIYEVSGNIEDDILGKLNWTELNK